MAHNQMQFQQIYKRLGLTLRKCNCEHDESGFANVDYYKGKKIVISHCPTAVLILNRDECPWVKTEEDFVKLAVERWNNKEYTSC
ncbi:hypothetical protein [uncultured Phascolarctobacterium sp.]|uniref:hypothetical protein n=1 Tax=uncultured Phascolarctobacterium sp. TaxID=512296 RepID=UPI0026139DB9|nr:hypothetical protein [uncultured Phascolarctobacterium sp.]